MVPVNLPENAELVISVLEQESLTVAERRKRFIASAGVWKDDGGYWEEFLRQREEERDAYQRAMRSLYARREFAKTKYLFT